MNNQMNLLKAFFNRGGSPQALIQQMLGKNNNPMIGNLMNLAKSGNQQDIENFARNICKEKRN